MIFSLTIKQVLAGTKTQTCRLAHPGDTFIRRPSGEYAAAENEFGATRVRWEIDSTYAVCPGRGKKSRGRILITGLSLVSSVAAVADEAFAKAEGFKSLAEFLESWRGMHGKNADKPAWVLTFELVKKGAATCSV